MSPAPVAVPGVTAGPVVQASRAAGSPGAPGAQITFPTVQREGTPGTQGQTGGTSGGTAGTSGGRAHSERELEELAQALFSRIRNRLRADILHDREAKGLTFDNV